MNPRGYLMHVCRGSDELVKNFAARWSGYLMVVNAGTYRFEIEADDGARLVIGEGSCHGVMCGSWAEVQNVRLKDLRPTTYRDGTYAKPCPLCAGGDYTECWVTDNGCEPFALWQLESDGGTEGAGCGDGLSVSAGSRYLGPGMHPIRLEFFQRGGGGRLIVRYSGPDTGGSMVPLDPRKLIFPERRGLRSEWFTMPEPLARLPTVGNLGTVSDGQLVKIEDDRLYDNAPGIGTFSDQVAGITDPLLVRWTGFLDIVNPGTYTFTLSSDDGSRLILGGRGRERERILVDNDGIKDRMTPATSSAYMLSGRHPIRIEYFHMPDKLSLAIQNYPGIALSYNGPDTQDVEKLVSSFSDSPLRTSDSECSMTSFQWGGGMSVSRDCDGYCFVGSEGLVGDGTCDNGYTDIGLKLQRLTCPVWNDDNGDCSSDPPEIKTTPRPEFTCYVSCPSGDFRRKSCARCPVTSENGICIENQRAVAGGCGDESENPSGVCSYQQCCVAHLSGLEGWGSDCLAFGAVTNCTHELEHIIRELREAPPSLYTRAYYHHGRSPPLPTGHLTRACAEDRCNEVPDGFILNPFTGDPTDERVCPTEESSSPGTLCFEGPWGVTGLKDPFTECQDGEYQWNFCQNRKTFHGRPFSKCCSFVYLDHKGDMECRFAGLPGGSCEEYIKAVQFQLSTDRFTAIHDLIVLDECEGNECNDPSKPVTGCPESVIERPVQTQGGTHYPDAGPDVAQLLAEAPPREEDDPPWTIVGVVVGAVLLVCITAAMVWHFRKVPPSSPWHSDKAHVVCDNTWIEPEQDHEVSLEYGVVKPRPEAFRIMVRQNKAEVQAGLCDPTEISVKALRLNPAFVSPEVVGLSENYIACVKKAAEAGVDSPYTLASGLRTAGVASHPLSSTDGTAAIANHLQEIGEGMAPKEAMRHASKRIAELAATVEDKRTRSAALESDVGGRLSSHDIVEAVEGGQLSICDKMGEIARNPSAMKRFESKQRARRELQPEASDCLEVSREPLPGQPESVAPKLAQPSYPGTWRYTEVAAAVPPLGPCLQSSRPAAAARLVRENDFCAPRVAV